MDALFGGPVVANDNFRKCVKCDGNIDRTAKRGPKPKYCENCCSINKPPVFTEWKCAHCEKKIVGRRRKFCDSSCRDDSRRKPPRRKAERQKPERKLISGTCPQCGAAFLGRPDKVFCSRTCTKKHCHSRRVRDLVAENEKRHANAPEKECEHCGVTFKRKTSSKDAARFCSRKCGYDARANIPYADPVLSGELMEIAASFSVSFRTNMCRCKQCLRVFNGKTLADRYCSEECAEKYRRAKYIAHNDNGRDRSPRPCAECGLVFAPVYGEMNRKFCSQTCSKRNSQRAGKLRRKAALRAAYVESVDPIKVFERDKWKCQICGVKTPRKLRGTIDDHLQGFSSDS
ncbi:hypothetical protein SAMN02982989_3183 [Xaviernesmea oryzae]|uniref:Uncharacterized protein n=1 Tax=Xaviernesmea oryzae TaxID=464029 RepID=A0A1X7FJC3_9HYPH|nr:hypothetical protein SAMN02982989_3183 [Xaviernesmea oryzae]